MGDSATACFDLAFLMRLLAIPSVTDDCVRVNEAMEAMRAWLEARGVSTAMETDPEAGRKVLYAATTPGKCHDYVFVTHLDVVAGTPEQFVPRIQGDRLYARGSGDTKGNAVVIAQILANLVGSGASVGAVFASDEETAPTGGTPSPELMLKRGYVPRRFIMVGDTTGDSPRTLFTAEKGHAVFTLVAYGKGGHSSLAWQQDNPVTKLCAGYLKFRAAWPEPTEDSDPWQTFVSPTRLEGSPSVNAVPDRATMSLSCRYVADGDYDRVFALLKETTGLEVLGADPKKHRRPVVTDEHNDDVQALHAALKSEWPDFRLGRMNAATDASRYAHLKLPTVIYGAVCANAHAADEWVSVSDLSGLVKVLSGFLKQQAGASGKKEK